MTITPNETLRGWLTERGMAAELEAGLVLDEAQQELLAELRQTASTFRHYDEQAREAWAVWTAYTHATHKPQPAIALAAPPPEPEPAEPAPQLPAPGAVVAELPRAPWWEAPYWPWLRWLVLLGATAWRHC